jgi:hypothetical protein
MRVTVGVIVTAIATGCNAKSLVHSDERKETNHDTEAEKEIPVRLDHNETNMVRRILAKEDLGKQVEQRVTQKATHSESNHDRQGGGVDVGRA